MEHYSLKSLQLRGSSPRNSPYFMESEGSLPHPQAPRIVSSPEPARSNPGLSVSVFFNKTYPSDRTPKQILFVCHFVSLNFYQKIKYITLTKFPHPSKGCVIHRFRILDIVSLVSVAHHKLRRPPCCYRFHL